MLRSQISNYQFNTMDVLRRNLSTPILSFLRWSQISGVSIRYFFRGVFYPWASLPPSKKMVGPNFDDVSTLRVLHWWLYCSTHCLSMVLNESQGYIDGIFAPAKPPMVFWISSHWGSNTNVFCAPSQRFWNVVHPSNAVIGWDPPFYSRHEWNGLLWKRSPTTPTP